MLCRKSSLIVAKQTRCFCIHLNVSHLCRSITSIKDKEVPLYAFCLLEINKLSENDNSSAVI